jgi:hypothetical protein
MPWQGHAAIWEIPESSAEGRTSLSFLRAMRLSQEMRTLRDAQSKKKRLYLQNLAQLSTSLYSVSSGEAT